jgi:protein gp37
VAGNRDRLVFKFFHLLEGRAEGRFAIVALVFLVLVALLVCFALRYYNVSQYTLRGYRVMADKSTIEWTDATWNPVTGCTKISAGCDNCYAARFSERFRGVPGHPFESGFDLTLRTERLLQPLAWKRSRMIFVHSMSDLFHKEIPPAHISAVFDTMEKADWHVYQVLTKRSSLLQKFINDRYKARKAPAHMWFGVSVENEQASSRIVHLQKANASVRFLSIEPLIAPLGKLCLDGIHG